MSALDRLFKKLQSTLDEIFSSDTDSAKLENTGADNSDVKRATMDEIDDHPQSQAASEANAFQDAKSREVDDNESLGANSAQDFKPQVLDNGRTLLLGIMRKDNNTQGNEKLQQATPPLTGAPSIGRMQQTLSADEIAALLDTPVEEEKDAAIVYKLKCSKCDVNGKIDSFTETFVCPLCGGTMYLIEVYANHSQHSPEEIKQELCVLYSKYIRGDSRAQRTWTLLTSQSHSDRKLEEYMRQYIKPQSSVVEKAPSSSSVIVSRANREIHNTTQGFSRIELSPTAFRSATPKPIQFTNVAQSANSPVTKPGFLIPELERVYKNVNESYSVKSLSSNNDQSLLRGLGYKVGKSSKLIAIDRRKILVKAFVADASIINTKWNKPMTQGRVTALIALLRRLNDSDRYKLNDFSVAIKHRNEDIAWLLNYSVFLKEAKKIAKTM